MKTQNTYDRIKGYIDHCIDDAIRSTDGAELRPQFWFKVVGNDMIFHVQICEPSIDAKAEATVIKKILWRLNTNVKLQSCPGEDGNPRDYLHPLRQIL